MLIKTVVTIKDIGSGRVIINEMEFETVNAYVEELNRLVEDVDNSTNYIFIGVETKTVKR